MLYVIINLFKYDVKKYIEVDFIQNTIYVTKDYKTFIFRQLYLNKGVVNI